MNQFLPTDSVPVVRIDPQTRQRELVQLRWGLVPSSVVDPSTGTMLLHARAETVAAKPSFRQSFRHRRCLMVVDSFDVGKRRGGSHVIQMKDERPFGVGAIWDRWQRGGTDPLESCVVITTSANALVQPINARMPVIIADNDYGRWLDPDFYDLVELQRMMQPLSPEEMVVVPG